METATNRLILKANRSLGSHLAEARLVTIEQLDAANEIFISRLREGELRDASLLRVLIYDLQVVSETQLLGHIFEHARIGGVNLDGYNIQEAALGGSSLEACVATWTLPIDHWHGMTILATAYYLSDFVRSFWQERINGPISWLVCPYGQLDAYFEKNLATAEVEEPAVNPA